MNVPPEHRRDWGETVSLFVVLALFFALRNRYTIGGPRVTIALGIALAATCAISFFATLRGSRSGARAGMKLAAGVLGLSLVASMTRVVYLVVYSAKDIQGTRLLETAAMIWVSNVVVFAVVYHLLGDREFVFPRPDDDGGKPMRFLDYLFLSFTTSTAFSPTDTPPLTTRGRMYMMFESAISLTTIAIAAARAVNILE